MTSPQCVDPASHVVDVITAALREAFDPHSDCPPDGRGATDVWFFASDGGWPFATSGIGCKEPMLWVRVDRRYRSRQAEFPQAFVGENPCGAGVMRVLAVEIGVARCVSADAKPNREKLAREALISLDDSWRIDAALCGVVARLKKDRAVATDVVAPTGPEGQLMAWTGMVYAQL